MSETVSKFWAWRHWTDGHAHFPRVAVACHFRSYNLADIKAYCNRNYDIRLKEYGETLSTSIATSCDEKVSPNYSTFKILLRKKYLLSRLEFLCCCVELHDDMVWCIKQWKEMCGYIETLNSHVITPSRPVSPAKIAFADVCDILVNRRAQNLCYSLIQCEPHRFLELVMFERHLIRGIIALIIEHTSLLSGVCDNIHLLLESWEECSGTLSTEWVELCSQLEGRVWQSIGQTLVEKIRMLPQDRQMAVKEMYKVLSGTIKDNPSVCKCLWYVVQSIDVSDVVNTSNREIGQLLPNLSQSSSILLKDFQTQTIAPLSRQMRALQPYSSGTMDQMSTNAKLAKRVDMLRLCYPLLISLHHSISIVTRWTLSSFQDRISHEHLSLVAQSLTNMTPLLDGVYQEMVAPCDVPGPSDAPHCWIVSWSASAYATFIDSIKLSEWQEKCKKLLAITFPTPAYWKKLNKRKNNNGDGPSDYIATLNHQLLQPLSHACHDLEPAEQFQLLYVLLSLLFYEFRRSLLNGNFDLRIGSAKQLLIDFNHLLSLLTASNVHCDVQNKIPSYPICKDIAQGLAAVIGGQQNTADNCEIAVKGSFHKLLGHLDVFDQISAFCKNDWKFI